MKLTINLKNGQILEFLQREENFKRVDEMYHNALSSKRLFILLCTNGDFLIDPSDISFMKLETDEPLEIDEKQTH